MHKIRPNEIEGKDFINCNSKSSTKLGKMLHNTHNFEFNTIVGKCVKVQNFLDYCIHEGAPLTYLLNKNTKSTRLEKLKKKTIPNYWGICVYVLFEKISQNEELKNLLKENTLPLTVYYEKTIDSVVSDKQTVVIYAYGLTKYVEIINKLSNLLKEDKFDQENIKTLIKEYSKTENLFDGTNISLR